jgi:ABC-type nitrate/sulfonate/bicarbonate transport system substrate-binding protein
MSLTTVQLGFKAFDAHELLCHFLAVEAGLYKRHRLQIQLIDITFTTDTDLPTFQVSCGAALSSALRGTPLVVVFVATDRPMFWLYASSDIKSLQDLKNRIVATFPAVAPPHHLANIILRRASVDPAEDIVALAVRDDVARFGLLKTGNADAAVISSAISPMTVAQAGFHELCFFGDAIRLPSTGLAVDATQLQQNAGLVETLVTILKESLELLHGDPGLVALVLQQYFDVAGDLADKTAAMYEKYFTHNGRTSPEIAQLAVDSLRRSLQIDTPIRWQEFYDFSLTD